VPHLSGCVVLYRGRIYVIVDRSLEAFGAIPSLRYADM
jgi:hypothetical protein